MKSAIAILTFRRIDAIKTFLGSLVEHGLHAKYPIAVFEDCGNWDDTVYYLTKYAKLVGYDPELDSDKYEWTLGENTSTCGVIQIFISRKREGVAGGSNKAIRWFERNDYDHLCLCNDDLAVTGDFVAEYQQAVEKLGFEYLTFNDFTDETHKPTIVKYKMRDIRLITRMVGIMVSLTKRVVKTIGYYDYRFGKFGEEHCEYNNRARISGFLNLNNQPVIGLDIVSKYLKHQELESCITPAEKTQLDSEASMIINMAVNEYSSRSWYRPYYLWHPPFTDAPVGTGGIRTEILDTLGYGFVYEHAQEDSW